MATTTITFAMEPGDNAKDFADPIATLCIVKDINDLLRGLDKWGSDYKDVPSAIEGIRHSVHELCSDLGEEWL